MELWKTLAEESEAFFKRMRGYDSLPEEQRIGKFRCELKDAEAKILELVDGKYEGDLYGLGENTDDMDLLGDYIGKRYFALSKMFTLHCSDAEVKRIEAQNAHLLELSNDMFARTGKMYRYILDMPVEEKDDDIDIEGTLKYIGEDVLLLEDDNFYDSDFRRMIPIVAFYESEHNGDLAIMECHANEWRGGKHKSSMTDKELDVENFLDDGKSWAESWLRHPKLDHIVMCYATHAIVTHYDYSIPDFMRMNSFEVKVTVELQQISEQDGSRLWWWDKSNRKMFAEKFLHEAEHRPIGMSKGEFIWKRVVGYFEIEEKDAGDRFAIENQERLVEKFPETEIRRDLFPADRMASLPDCRKDDSLIEEFLKKVYEIERA